MLAVSAAAVSAVAVSGCSHQDTVHGASAAKTTQAAEALPPQPSLPATPPMPSASAAATTAPSAAGQVKGGVHTGDLRTFFLPAPQHALPYGDPDGDRLDPVDVGDTTDRAVAVARLKQYHYAEGFGRTYSLPGDHLTVTIRLARFGSPALAAGYFGRLHYTGSAIRPLTLHEPFPVTAQQTVPGAPYRELFATTCQGDVQMMVRVVSTTNAMPARKQLTSLLEAQYQRLRTGH
ncbi:hypothetical protein [Actinacidiphila acidipaludis]|uniref:Lipoprotein n=1 Tax=Actinacidiphila acidipaludis TaxID=2873382 RepID=A0ABS7QGX0_9ACTN|nr:hypothetical protein [Streptomyces acidipaludis]MBY8882416.1 hypothetical protein [Streptomyces acidipaludis]